MSGVRRVAGLCRSEVATIAGVSHRLYPSWEAAADAALAILHTEAGRVTVPRWSN